MDSHLQATFMPRQSAVPGEAYIRPKSPPNFFMAAGILVFVLALASTGALYFYKNFLTTRNADKEASVKAAIKNFEPELTKELTILKARMDAGKSLLQNHKSFSLLLNLLESNTAQTVRFSDFSYTVAPDNKISLAMKGEARFYNDIAFQSDVFSKIPQIKSPLFTNLVLDDKGMISFSVTAELDPTAVAYSKLVTPVASTTPTQTVSGSVATSTATTTSSTATTTPSAPAPRPTTTTPPPAGSGGSSVPLL